MQILKLNLVGYFSFKSLGQFKFVLNLWRILLQNSSYFPYSSYYRIFELFFVHSHFSLTLLLTNDFSPDENWFRWYCSIWVEIPMPKDHLIPSKHLFYYDNTLYHPAFTPLWGSLKVISKTICDNSTGN